MNITKRNAVELSQQQINCLERLANGQTYSDIAQALSLSELTINLLVSNASQKLDASSTAHAVVISIKEKLIHIQM